MELILFALLAAVPLRAQVRPIAVPLPELPLTALPSASLEMSPLGSLALPEAPLALPALPTRLESLHAAPFKPNYQEWEKAHASAERMAASVSYPQDETVIGVELRQGPDSFILVLHALGDKLSHFQRTFDGYPVVK